MADSPGHATAEAASCVAARPRRTERHGYLTWGRSVLLPFAPAGAVVLPDATVAGEGLNVNDVLSSSAAASPGARPGRAAASDISADAPGPSPDDPDGSAGPRLDGEDGGPRWGRSGAPLRAQSMPHPAWRSPARREPLRAATRSSRGRPSSSAFGRTCVRETTGAAGRKGESATEIAEPSGRSVRRRCPARRRSAGARRRARPTRRRRSRRARRSRRRGPRHPRGDPRGRRRRRMTVA